MGSRSVNVKTEMQPPAPKKTATTPVTPKPTETTTTRRRLIFAIYR